MSALRSRVRLGNKAPLSEQELRQIDAYWRAANYLTACQLYLLDNPLLERPLVRSDIKQTVVGHWGTCPGQNFIYTHLDLRPRPRRQRHGGPGLAGRQLHGGVSQYHPG